MSTFKALVALAGICAFTACDNEEVVPDQMAISIAKQPEFVVTSGGHTLVSSLATRAGQEGVLLYFKKADCPDLYRQNFPAQKLYKEECEHVYECIKEDAALIAAGEAPKYEIAKNSFAYKNFYIVNAYSSKDHDAMGNHSNVAGDMHDLGINGVKITEFNTNTCIAACLVMTPLGLQQVTYDDSFGEKRNTYTVEDWKLFYIPEEGDQKYGYYIGMNAHLTKDATHGDGDFSDWVVKVIPAEIMLDPVDETNGSVEINVNVNDEHPEGDWIATKTSIHIRALSDVDIFIPVDKKYYCEADDMDISISHKQYDVVYNTQPHFVQKVIGGKILTFTVSYEDAGIHITTDGMCREILTFCQNEYADGVTFEVWNYFKDITRDDLKPMLDQAKVTFLDHNVKTYINAFAKRNFEITTPIHNKFNDAGQLVPYTDEACTKPLDPSLWTRVTPDDKDYIFLGVKNPWDCSVTPAEPFYKATYPDETDPALTDYNVVWTF